MDGESVLAVLLLMGLLLAGCIGSGAMENPREGTPHLATNPEPPPSPNAEAAIPRYTPQTSHEAFLFHLESPPEGMFRFQYDHERAGSGGGIAHALLVSRPEVASASGAARSYWDYAYVGLDGTSVVHCCPQEASWTGEKTANFVVPPAAPFIAVAFLVSGWFPSEDAGFRVWIEDEVGRAHLLPLIDHSEAVFIDFRDELRGQGTVVTVNGVTMVDTEGSVSIDVPQPSIASVVVNPRQGRFLVEVERPGLAASAETRVPSIATLASASQPLRVDIEALDRPYGMTGHLLSCACTFPVDVTRFNGDWTVEERG